MRRFRILLFYGIIILFAMDGVLLVRDDWRTTRYITALMITFLYLYKRTSRHIDGKH